MRYACMHTLIDQFCSRESSIINLETYCAHVPLVGEARIYWGFGGSNTTSATRFFSTRHTSLVVVLPRVSDARHLPVEVLKQPN